MNREEAIERIRDLLETEVYHQAGPGEPHEVDEELAEIVNAMGAQGRCGPDFGCCYAHDNARGVTVCEVHGDA